MTSREFPVRVSSRVPPLLWGFIGMSAGLREVHFPECKFERSIDVFLRAPLEDQIAGPRLAPDEGGGNTARCAKCAGRRPLLSYKGIPFLVRTPSSFPRRDNLMTKVTTPVNILTISPILSLCAKPALGRRPSRVSVVNPRVES